MPVTVQVPLRIVVDPQALASCQDDLGEAVSAATERALANAVAVIEDSRGGYVEHRPARPVMTWGGDALTEVADRTRQECEMVVHEAIARAVAATMPQPEDTYRDSLAERLTSEVAEIADRTRLAALAGLYVIPGYLDGEPEAVNFDFGDDEALVIRGGNAPTLTWRRVTLGDGTWEIFNEALIAYYSGHPPAQTGVVFLSDDNSYTIFAWRHPSGQWLADIALPQLSTIEPEVTGTSVTTAGSVTLRRTDHAPSADATSFTLRTVGPGMTVEQRSTVFRDFFGPSLLPAIANEVRRLAPSADALAVAQERLREIGDAWATGQEAWASYIQFTVDGLPFLIPSGDDFAPDMDVELVPIVRPATGEESGGGGGGGTGTEPAGDGSGGERGDGEGSGTGDGEGAGDGGRRRRGGILGDTAEGSTLWPVTAIGGETLKCEAYLAEPTANQLVDDYGLGERMRQIARMLEVDECGYLGKFAINCAKIVAARARGVGVACAAASTMTEVTVRHDGSGNNGFLDVQPGQSPEFGYLTLLAEIASDVHQFGTEVVSCYLDQRNAHLVRVDPEREPDAAGWALRYVNEFPGAMRHGFMHLYAETCRVLLLQQLRTSRSGILARIERFPQTLTSFSQTLDILGETVVQLSTLRRAIRHSESVTTTGTVRHVLSVSETTYGPNDTEIEEPAPILFVPTLILEAVGDATIERRDSGRVAIFQGRSWTVEELDMAIGTRRNLINRIDPLFLQVSDLDSLYRRVQFDSTYAETYLMDLLIEMSSANLEMRDEASVPENGAFFALEASQYIRREGGRDWRGLRFELQGIHALADGVLRPHIGSSYEMYGEGVNDAISRKADFDSFLTIFATVGIIALALLCAPLGAVAVAAVTGLAGLALTIHDVMEADRQTDLYHALEDPELFLRWQEVQLAQFMAVLSVAFSVFDVVGVGRAAHVIVGAASRGLRVAGRAGVGMAVRSVSRSVRREVIRNMTREVLENAVRQAVWATTIVAVMNELLPRAIAPFLVPWLRRQAMEHGTLDEVDAALGELAEGLPTPVAVPTDPDPAEVDGPADTEAGEVP